MPRGAKPADTAAALPPLDPPGTRARSHGLRLGPYAQFSVDVDDVARAGLLARDHPAQLGRGKLPDLGHGSSMIRGTLNRPCSTSGAVERAFSCERHGPISSGRNTFFSGSACDVGGTSSVA